MRQLKVYGILSLHRYPTLKRKTAENTSRKQSDNGRKEASTEEEGGKKPYSKSLLSRSVTVGSSSALGLRDNKSSTCSWYRFTSDSDGRNSDGSLVRSPIPLAPDKLAALSSFGITPAFASSLRCCRFPLSLAALSFSLSSRSQSSHSIFITGELSTACHLLLNRKCILSIYTPVLLDENASNHL